MLIPERENPEPFLESIFSDPPECTISFNGLLPDDKGQFFCDMIKIPHIAYITDYPNQYVSLTQSPLNIIACPDVFACNFFMGLNFNNVLFLPQGVNKSLSYDPSVEKKYDVVMLATCIDFLTIRTSWEEKYTKEIIELLDIAATIALSNDTIPYYEALVQAINEKNMDISKFNILEILTDLDIYIKGKARMDLLQAINKAQVHVFGAYTKACWKKYVGKENPNIHLHDAVPYEEALEIMQQSKIVLNSCPWMRNGGHERVFAAMAHQAVVITDKNKFLANNFKENQDIFFYKNDNPEMVNDYIASLLEDEDKRKKIASNANKLVMSAHTWDVRVKSLLKQLPKMLEDVKKTAETTT